MVEALYISGMVFALGAVTIGAAAGRWRYGVLPLYLLAAVLQMLTWGMRFVWSQQTIAARAPEGIWVLMSPPLWSIFFVALLGVALTVYVLVGTSEFRRLVMFLIAIDVFVVALQLAVALHGMPVGDGAMTAQLGRLATDPFHLFVPLLMMVANLLVLAVGYQFLTNLPRRAPLSIRIFAGLTGPLAFNLCVLGMLWLAGQWEVRVLVGGLPSAHVVTAGLLTLVLWPYMTHSLKRYDPVPFGRGVFDIFAYEARLRRTSRALRAARSRYARLFDTVREMIFFADREGRITECNAASTELLGRETRELAGSDLFETLCSDPDQAAELRRTLEVRGEVIDLPVTVGHPDGAQHTALISCRRLSNRDDPPSGYEGIVKDITELVETQRRLERTNRALVEAGRDLDDFLHITDHHLRHSLAAIGIYNDMIQERIDVEQGDLFHYTERVKSNIRRMQEQVDALVTLSRVGRSGQETEPVSLVQTVREIAADLMEHYAERDPMIEWPEDDVTVPAIPVELHQLLWNLLANAIQNARPDIPPTVRVEWEQGEGEVAVKVVDNGVGIDGETLETLFDTGADHLDEASRSGSGMGLKICQKIVTRRGGRLWAESEPDEGSTFVFTIPCTDPVEMPSEREAAGRRGETSGTR